MDKSLNNLAKGGVIILIGLFLSKFLTYIYRIILARGLETTGYGILNTSIAIISLITITSLLGLNMGILRYIPNYKVTHQINKIKGTIISSIKIILITGIFSNTILILSSKWIATNLFKDKSLFIIIIILSPFIILSNLNNIFLVTLRALQKTKYIVISRDFILPLTKIAITLLAFYLGYHLIGAIGAIILSLLISTMTSAYFVQKKAFNLINKETKSVSTIKKLLPYSIPLMISYILYSIINWTDTIILSYFKSNAEVGIYNAALPTSNLLLTIPFGITFLFIPIITELYKKQETKKIKSDYNTITRWMILANIPILLILILFSKEILTLFFGTEYLIGSTALIILSIGNFIFASLYASTEFLKVVKKTKQIMGNNLIATILNVILNFILIPKYGMIGGAIATSISLTIYSILSYKIAYKYVKIEKIKEITLIILTAIITYITIILLHRKINNFLISIAILIIIYLLLCKIFKCFKQEEIQMVKGLIKDTIR